MPRLVTEMNLSLLKEILNQVLYNFEIVSSYPFYVWLDRQNNILSKWIGSFFGLKKFYICICVSL